MTIKKINNFFTEDEFKVLVDSVHYSLIPLSDDGNFVDYKLDNEGRGIHHQLGRLQFGGLKHLPGDMLEKICKIAKDISGEELLMSNATAVEYNSLYGEPNLPIHFDHDSSDLIINFQLSSNTIWDLGIDLQVYSLEDNSALIFNPNQYTHWRPKKIFKDKEYIRMIFFRFEKENPSDYSHLDYPIEHEIFKEIEEFRNSLGNS